MIKLLFGRLLPAGAAAVILTSALSPLRPALDAFGAAAIALTGQEPAPVAGGGDFGSDLVPQRAQQSKPREQKKKLQELASRLRDPNAPQLKEFQAPANARSAPRFRPVERPLLLPVPRWRSSPSEAGAVETRSSSHHPAILSLAANPATSAPRFSGGQGQDCAVRTGERSLPHRPYSPPSASATAP